MKDEDNKDQPGSDNDRVDQADTPLFSGFEEGTDYEEPDRDTDYTSIYREDGIEDEEFADTLFEEEEDPEPVAQDSWGTSPSDEGLDEFDDREVSLDGIFTADEDPAQDDQDEWPLEANETQAGDDFTAEEDDDWENEEEYYEEDPRGDAPPTWPLGLIAVAIIALLLLMAGGYGVIQQRSATQEEIRRLQAALATSVTPDKVAETRDALEDAGQRNFQLQAMVDALKLENRRLTDTVTGLETQLDAQQQALAPPAGTALPGPKPVAAPAPEPEPTAATEVAPAAQAAPVAKAVINKPKKAAPPPTEAPEPASDPVAVSSDNSWFVNFASYGVQATAHSWVSKLAPSAGRAVVTTGTKNGRTFYRVRVIDLPSREIADRVAQELAAKHRLPKLWVGKQS